MAISKISAFVQVARLEDVEQRLLELGVPGYSFFKVKGRGDYGNLYSQGGTTQHICVELFIDEGKVKDVVEGIIDVAHTGVEGDGIITVGKIDSLYRIGTRELLDGDL